MEQERIFISYSRVNSDFALRLARDLKSAGVNIWIDQLDIPTGARWDDVLEKALEESSVFLILLSPESIGSQNVKDEVGFAIDAGKRILPVVVKSCTIPLRLRRFQFVDFTTKSYEESLDDIKGLIGYPHGTTYKTAWTEKPAAAVPVSPMAAPKQARIDSAETKMKSRSKATILGLGSGLVAMAVIVVFLVGKVPSSVSAQEPQQAEFVSPPKIALSSQDFLDSNTNPFLDPTEALISEDGRYELALHNDGNLVLKDKGNPVWSSETAGNEDILYLHMQEDGNLVMYGQNLRFIWSSDTSVATPEREYILLLQNDGNLVIYTFDGEPIWAIK